MHRKLAQLIRKNCDELSRRWAEIISAYYPGYTHEEVFRKVRASHLLLARSLIEQDFSYLFKHLQNEFREWILLKNSYRDIMTLEPVYIMLLEEFVRESRLSDEEKRKLIELIQELRAGNLRESFYAIYAGEQETLFTRQIGELEVLNDVAGTDLVGKGSHDGEMAEESKSPVDLLKTTLSRAMAVLGASDGVLAYKLDGKHEVAVKFLEAPEKSIIEAVKAETLTDLEDQFDPRVLVASAMLSTGLSSGISGIQNLLKI